MRTAVIAWAAFLIACGLWLGHFSQSRAADGRLTGLALIIIGVLILIEAAA